MMVSAEPPNPWSILHDDAKSHITLATALLGLTATFADRLLSEDGLGRLAVFAGWALLVGSIVCSISANGKVVGGLKGESNDYNAASGWLNASVYLLLMGAVLLTTGAWRTSVTSDNGVSPSALARRAIVEMTGASGSEIMIESLEKLVGNDFVLIVRPALQSTERFEVTVDGDRDEVILVQEIQP